MSFGRKGEDHDDYPQALPITTVDSVADAEALIVRTCKHSYGEDPRYILSRESGFVDSNYNTIETAGEYLERIYKEMI
jgi:hypothetical protein